MGSLLLDCVGSFLFFPFLFVLSVSGIVGQRWLLSVAGGETGLNGTRAS